MSKNIQVGILYKTEHGLNVKWLLEETESVAHTTPKRSKAGEAT